MKDTTELFHGKCSFIVVLFLYIYINVASATLSSTNLVFGVSHKSINFMVLHFKPLENPLKNMSVC